MNIVCVLHIKHFSVAPSSQATALSLPEPSRATSVSRVLAPLLSIEPKPATTPKRAALAMVEAVDEADDRTSLQFLPSASSPHLPEEGHNRPQAPQDAMSEAVPAAAPVEACSGPLPRAGPLATPDSEQVGESLLLALQILCNNSEMSSFH